MTWDSSKNILRNDFGDPVPQVWDEELGDWVVYDNSAKDVNAKLTGSNVTNEILSAVTYAQKGPIYLGVKKFGTLEYNSVEQPLPLRPWRSGTSNKYPAVINNDAGESTNVSFDGNTISIAGGDLFTATVGIGHILREDDEIEVDTTEGTNDGTYTVESMTTEEIVVKGASPQFTTQDAATAGTTTIYAFGDILEQDPSDCDIVDTSDTAANVLRWHHFVDEVNGELKHIYICDRHILSDISWNDLNGEGWILGTEKTIDGKTGILRSLTGGAANRDGEGSTDYGGGILPNEWNRYVLNGVDSEGPFFDGAPTPADEDYLVSSSLTGDNAIRRDTHNQAWHWLHQYSWCQEVAWHDASRRASRGLASARYWTHPSASPTTTNRGFRPAFVI